MNRNAVAQRLPGVFQRAGLKFDPLLWPYLSLPTPCDLHMARAAQQWKATNGDRETPSIRGLVRN